MLQKDPDYCGLIKYRKPLQKKGLQMVLEGWNMLIVSIVVESLWLPLTETEVKRVCVREEFWSGCEVVGPLPTWGVTGDVVGRPRQLMEAAQRIFSFSSITTFLPFPFLLQLYQFIHHIVTFHLRTRFAPILRYGSLGFCHVPYIWPHDIRHPPLDFNTPPGNELNGRPSNTTFPRLSHPFEPSLENTSALFDIK